MPSTSTLYTDGLVRIAMAGEEALIIEYGSPKLEMSSRLAVEMWERRFRARPMSGVRYINTCIRSSLVDFDSSLTSREALFGIVVDTARDPIELNDVKLSIRIHRFPVVIDDPWTKRACEDYMKNIRDQAVYLPDNIDYVARNNGRPVRDVSTMILGTPWIVMAQGFFMMLPMITVSLYNTGC